MAAEVSSASCTCVLINVGSVMCWDNPGSKYSEVLPTQSFLTVGLNVDFNSFIGSQVPGAIRLGDFQRHQTQVVLRWNGHLPPPTLRSYLQNILVGPENFKSNYVSRSRYFEVKYSIKCPITFKNVSNNWINCWGQDTMSVEIYFMYLWKCILTYILSSLDSPHWGVFHV